MSQNYFGQKFENRSESASETYIQEVTMQGTAKVHGDSTQEKKQVVIVTITATTKIVISL